MWELLSGSGQRNLFDEVDIFLNSDERLQKFSYSFSYPSPTCSL